MITADQRRFIATHAYVPEHLPAYVTAITGGQPHLVGDFVVYRCGDRLIFVGYPLSTPIDDAALIAAYDTAQREFRPRLTSITAPSLPGCVSACKPAGMPAGLHSETDVYYRLDLAEVRPPKKLRNLLRRAESEVTVQPAAGMGREHGRLVDEFLSVSAVQEDSRLIFQRLGRYVGSVGLFGAIGRLLPGHSDARGAGSPIILEARDDRGQLVAFDIVAYAGEFGFYLFNLRSRERYVPGTSDLLLAHLVADARARGKRYLNLGLGINPGVAYFKEKWGAVPFLPQTSCILERPRNPWEETLDAL